MVVISGHGTIETAVKAVRMGAHDFVEKPLSLEKTLLVVKNALRRRRLETEVRVLKQQLDVRYVMVGESAAMRRLRAEIAQAAPSNGRALIYGENGTGKELVARAIHDQSHRAQGPFVEVNCAAIPEELIESELFGHTKGSFTGALAARKGKFELADGGTLFLDEIGGHEPQDPGQGPARAAGAADRAGGRSGLRRGGRARHRRHQQEPRGGDPAGPASARTSTSAST